MNVLPDTVLLVGASGFLGRALCSVCAPDLKLIRATRTPWRGCSGEAWRQMDVTDSGQVRAVIAGVRPRWVVNTAAVTSVDRCESEPDLARRVHVVGTRHLTRACEETGSGLISISTNYVFDGTRGPYGEGDSPNPLSVYGQTKLECEAHVLEAQCPGVVVRTAVLYGYRPGCRPNFVTWALGAMVRGEKIRVATDEWANPTCVDELALFLLDLCRRDFEGLVHFAGSEFLTRYEMAQQICAHFRLDSHLAVPVASGELGQKARRPLRAGLRIGRARGMYTGPISGFNENLGWLAGLIGDPAAPSHG